MSHILLSHQYLLQHAPTILAPFATVPDWVWMYPIGVESRGPDEALAVKIISHSHCLLIQWPFTMSLIALLLDLIHTKPITRTFILFTLFILDIKKHFKM